MLLTWMADTLRATGLPVVEVPGWQTRGHGAMADVLGVLLHHTAGPATGNYPSLTVVQNGRPDLPGPLANLGLARDGAWYIIAAGQAWHAGSGVIGWCPRDDGNRHLIGVEAESTGVRDDWTPAQRVSYPRGVAALLKRLGQPADHAIGHKEWTSRKIDPAFWDMDAFRGDVARWMTGDDDMELTDRVPDLYTPDAKDTLTVGDTLAWACAHAARAKDTAERVEKKLDQLIAKLA